MPPHPPEETSVLNVHDTDPQLAVHPKDPFTFVTPKSLGFNSHKQGASMSIDYTMMAHQPSQESGHGRGRDNSHSSGRREVSFKDNGYSPNGTYSYLENSSECHVTSMVAPNGLQKRGAHNATYPNFLSLPSPEETQPPSPLLTPMGGLMPTAEPNTAAHIDPGYGGHHSQYSSQQYVQSNFHQNHSHYNVVQSQTPYPNMPSPQDFYHSPVNKLQFNYPSPYIQHQEHRPQHYQPLDSTAHYQSQDAYSDISAPPPYAPTAQSVGLKSTYVSIWKKATWVAFTMAIFLLPYGILKASFHLEISSGAWQTSVTYSMLMAIDFLAVIFFSTMNRRKVTRRVENRDPLWVGVSTGILAVGYREDPVLLEGCLKSLLAMRYQRNQRVLLVVDGNEQQDEYMAQIFMKVFDKQGPTVLRPNFLCMDRAASDKERDDFVRQAAYHPGPLCVMQPHHGKRAAMYTGFAILLQQGLESVVVTDSDTYLDPAVCKELAFALAESPIIGAATGDVRIYNTGTWVSFLSSIRYWFAFNLERGAQSYHSVVNCVSGPLGIYRMSIISEIMDDWAKQSFLGVLCTYGDDRHLTNLVLREGFKVKFSQYAICYTDTPIRFIAWVTQQTRWSKSFFREIPIQLGCMHLHSPWMTYALLYQLIYPMMTVYSLVNCIYFGTGSQMAWWIVSISLVGIIKAVYAYKVTGEKRFFFTTAYGLFYLVGYVPAKIYAALTLYDNSWGTSARLIRNFTQIQNYIAPVAWSTILVFGLINSPSRYFRSIAVPEGQSPPFLSDAAISTIMICFGVIYFLSYLWFFVRTGEITRDFKRDFSYEELFENMTSYTFVDGGKRKVARFEV
ncbi:Hyaluronan synthase 3 [Entomortierella beljakovae]|nr:Hyaluronan synthase 3 [Entomortierella beljakovae]